jgi:putative N-acetylmannosamine-6-phosphate epimerase
VAASVPASWEKLKRLKGALIVSCQASAGEPLAQPEHILALSLSALAGGARALRLEGVENIRMVRRHTDVPIVGLLKSAQVKEQDRFKEVYITRTYEDAAAVSEAGADLIALDATGRQRPEGLTLPELTARIHVELKKLVWADVASLDQASAAVDCGADLVSTTMYGYTEETKLPADAGPDFALLKTICETVHVPVILEGRVWHPQEVTRAFELGAYAVVVGSAITRPQLITSRFVRAIPGSGS